MRYSVYADKQAREDDMIDAYRNTARRDYQSDSVDIPEDAKVSWAEGGVWVEAQVWVAADPDEDPAAESDVSVYGAGCT